MSTSTTSDKLENREVTHETWQETFKDKYADHWRKAKGKAKILILCEDEEREKELCDQLMKEYSLEIVPCYGDKNKDYQLELYKCLEQFKPTHVVVSKRNHGFYTYIKSKGHNERLIELDSPGPDNTTRIIMNLPYLTPYIYYDTIHIHKHNYILYERWNIFMEGNFILVNPVVVTDVGVNDTTLQYLSRNSEIIKNDESTKILIISGSHGRLDGASAFSCSDVKKAPDIYQTTQEIFSQESNSLEADIKRFRKTAKDTPGVDKMTFKVLDVANYSFPHCRSFCCLKHFLRFTSSTGPCQVAAAELLRDIKDFNPSFIVIGWCYSAFGDVALHLRSNTIFAELALTYDIRKITNNADAILSKEQTDFLRKINERENGGYRYEKIFIQGVSGSGKTVCAVEVLKQRVANLRIKECEAEINLLVVLPNNSECDYKRSHQKIGRRDADSDSDIDNDYEPDYGQLGLDFNEKYLADIKEMSNVNVKFTRYYCGDIVLPDHFIIPDVLLVDEMMLGPGLDWNNAPQPWQLPFTGEVNEDTKIYEYDVSSYNPHNIPHKLNQTMVVCVTPTQLISAECGHRMKHHEANKVLTVSLSRGYRNSASIARCMDAMRSSVDHTNCHVYVEGDRFYPPPLFRNDKDALVHVYHCEPHLTSASCIANALQMIGRALQDIDDQLKNKEKQSGYDSVFVMYEPSFFDFGMSPPLANLLKMISGEVERKKWGKCKRIREFRGAEADVVIMFADIMQLSYLALSMYEYEYTWEGVSRARKQLFIIDSGYRRDQWKEVSSFNDCVRHYIYEDGHWKDFIKDN